MKKLFSGTNNRLMKTMMITLSVLLLVFILVIIIASCSNRKLSYEKIEKKMRDAAISYCEDNQDYQ